MEIELKKRYKYAGDIFEALIVKAGFPIEVATDLLNSIKDADVTPVVHGEWIPYEREFRAAGSYGRYYSYTRPINYRCSVCDRVSEIQEPYCHCGAKMDGGRLTDGDA